MPDRDTSITTVDNAPRAVRDHGRARLHRWWPWLLILMLVAGGGASFLFKRHSTAQSAANVPPSPPPVAIATRAAWRGNIAVHLDGLGTVTPLATVTVKTRVDGQLISVNYREGQMIHQGDLLATIDPRPTCCIRAGSGGCSARMSDRSTGRQGRLDVLHPGRPAAPRSSGHSSGRSVPASRASTGHRRC